MCSMVVPSLTNVSASSFPLMFACAMTLYNVVGCTLFDTMNETSYVSNT